MRNKILNKNESQTILFLINFGIFEIDDGWFYIWGYFNDPLQY